MKKTDYLAIFVPKTTRESNTKKVTGVVDFPTDPANVVDHVFYSADSQKSARKLGYKWSSKPIVEPGFRDYLFQNQWTWPWINPQSLINSLSQYSYLNLETLWLRCEYNSFGLFYVIITMYQRRHLLYKKRKYSSVAIGSTSSIGLLWESSVLLTSPEFNSTVRDFLCLWHWLLTDFNIIQNCIQKFVFLDRLVTDWISFMLEHSTAVIHWHFNKLQQCVYD